MEVLIEIVFNFFFLLFNLPGSFVAWLFWGQSMSFWDYVTGDGFWELKGKEVLQGCFSVCISLLFWGALIGGIAMLVDLSGYEITIG